MVLEPIRIHGLSNLFLSWLFRPNSEGVTVSCHIFGKGILDLIDDVFWNLPFSGARQAKRIRGEFNIPEDVWNTRIKWIRDEHRLPNARQELGRLWKERIAKDGASGTGAGAAQAVLEDPADRLPVIDD